ncbi:MULTISPECIES: hypothetical protein [unclassified Halomonas]|uniref:hypothetical protein n=1 Tax=unclassified Halomonas TaxID=2609666 RepID=UPI0018D227C7|nr:MULTISPECIES: hypothetical protein [unclassified Halomonas]QPP48698.1 hypothetical protein I4484_15975 [Halomonas sp. SS10-MC5]
MMAGGVAAAFLGPWNASAATGLIAGVLSGGPYLVIARFGAQRILIDGATLLIGTVLVANLGSSLAHFWVALVLLGVGWNFPFVGGSAMLATVHGEAGRGKVQGINDLIIFTLVTIGSLMAGQLFHHLGPPSI